MDKIYDRRSNQSKNKQILISFSVPKTPTQVKNELDIGKFNIKPYLECGLLKCLTPDVQKGRLYILTDKAKRELQISASSKAIPENWGSIAWILASPKQRLVVLKTLSSNSVKRTSEDIRLKCSTLNNCLSRTSTKSILKQLINRGFVETEMEKDRRRYYWLNEEGKSIAGDLKKLFP